METVIGLIGAKKAGKTTAFNAISGILDVQEVTLAAKLKDACAQVFGINRDWFDSHSFKEKDLLDCVFLTAPAIKDIFAFYGIPLKEINSYDTYVRPHIGKVLYTPRQVAQYVGTEILRNYSPDIHCESACSGIQKAIGVVTDMRFMNEYEYFAKNYRAFVPIYIQNTGAEIEAGRDTHASEAYLKELAKKAVETIPNNGPLEQFQRDVQLIIKRLVK